MRTESALCLALAFSLLLPGVLAIGPPSLTPASEVPYPAAPGAGCALLADPPERRCPRWTYLLEGSTTVNKGAEGLALRHDGAVLFTTGGSGNFFRLDTSQSASVAVTSAYDAAEGELLWTAVHEGPNGVAFARAVAVSPDGSKVYVAGTERAGSYDALVIAYRATTGDELWSTRIDVAGRADQATVLGVSPDGLTLYVGGQSLADGASTALVAALGSGVGDVLWVDTQSAAGGRQAAYALRVAPGGDAVFTAAEAEFSSPDTATVLAHAAGNGARLWTASIPGPRAPRPDGLDVTTDGALVLAVGHTSATPTQLLAVAFRADDGSLVWSNAYARAGARESWGNLVRVAGDGASVVVAGMSGSQLVLGLHAATGQFLWVGQAGVVFMRPLALALSPAGDAAVVAGWGRDAGRIEGADLTTAAYDMRTGALRWFAIDGGRLLDIPAGAAVSPNGERAYVAGTRAKMDWGHVIGDRVVHAYQSSSARGVLALIDSGVNPYHIAFRDTSALAFQHPCTYIVGYPCNATALPITLDAESYEEAVAKDKPIWDAVQQGKLYWIPGTKIVGAVRFGSGGINCPLVPAPPANIVARDVGGGVLGSCPAERNLLDDHGHGTMTASRSVGNAHSLCTECRLVVIEGLGPAGVRWAADQGWIDVQSNSWLNLVPPPANQLRGTTLVAACSANPSPSCVFNPGSTAAAFAYAQARMLTLAASGNGAAYILGFAPTPTYVLSTAAPGVILVGGHDNGRAALWSGAPAHVVADAYRGWAADGFHLTKWGPAPIACCTSAASPYAAGGAAAIVLEARRILGDTRTGARDGVLAEGPRDLVPGGPLKDGDLTLAEAKELLFKTAQARPQEGRDDGQASFVAELRAPGEDELMPYGPGGNPFCQGCVAAPLRWEQVPPGPAAIPLLGYGAVNEFSVAAAAQVMRGEAGMPDRGLEDQFFSLDAQVRQAFFVGT